jgi:hypothetical protein
MIAFLLSYLLSSSPSIRLAQLQTPNYPNITIEREYVVRCGKILLPAISRHCLPARFFTFPPRRGSKFKIQMDPGALQKLGGDNFSKVSRQDEGSNSTFQKFPAKTRVRIQLFKSFPPSRGFEFNFSKVSRQDEGSNAVTIRTLKDVELLMNNRNL